jgi:hypothetical protein
MPENPETARPPSQCALSAVDELDARGDLLAVDRGAEPAEIFEEKLAVRRIAPQPEMLARDVRKSFQLQIGPIIAASPARHDLIFRHAIGLAAGGVLIFDHGVYAGFRLRRGRGRDC